MVLYKLALTDKPADESLVYTTQMKAIGHYLHVVLIIMLYKVVLTFKSVDETLVCDHSNESY